MDSQEARENLNILLHGGVKKRQLSLREAKEMLRANDPGLNIRPSLQHLNRRETSQALLSITTELIAATSVPYLQPLINGVVLTFLKK